MLRGLGHGKCAAAGVLHNARRSHRIDEPVHTGPGSGPISIRVSVCIDTEVGIGEIDPVRRRGLLIAGKHIAPSRLGQAVTDHLLLDRLDLAGQADTASGIHRSGGSLCGQSDGLVHELGGGAERALGQVGIGLGHPQVGGDLGVSLKHGAELQQFANDIGSVGGHVHALTRGNLLAGGGNGFLYMLHIRQETLRL